MFDLIKFGPEETFYFSTVGHVRLVESDRVDHFTEVIGIERITYGSFRTASDENEEGYFAVDESCRQYSYDVALNIGALAFV